MNLNNVSALALSVPLDDVVIKVSEIQALRFRVESLEPTLDDKVRIVARLLESKDPLQTLEEIDFTEMHNKIRVFKDSKTVKKDPYVW